MRKNLSLGKLGERIASKYLLSAGYKIIEVNFQKRWGEIDIIAVDKNALVFVEVKTRMEFNTISPEASITPWKIRKLKQTGLFFKNLHPELPEILRIDFVGIELSRDLAVQRINLIKNISD